MFVGVCYVGFGQSFMTKRITWIALFVNHFTRFLPILALKDRYGLGFQNVLFFGMRGNGHCPEIE
jgi:hypothetical protein